MRYVIYIIVTLLTIGFGFVIDRQPRVKAKIIKKIMNNVAKLDKACSELLFVGICMLSILVPVIYFLISNIFEKAIGLNRPCVQILWPLLSVKILMGLYYGFGHIAKKIIPTIIEEFGIELVKDGLYTLMGLGVFYAIIEKNYYFISISISASVVFLGFFVSIDKILGIKTKDDLMEKEVTRENLPEKEPKKEILSEKRTEETGKNRKITNIDNRKKVLLSDFGVAIFVSALSKIPIVEVIFDMVLCVLFGIVIFILCKQARRYVKQRRKN